MDADGGADREEHVCVAGAAVEEVRRHIHRLDQIPDEELALLATGGSTGSG